MNTASGASTTRVEILPSEVRKGDRVEIQQVIEDVDERLVIRTWSGEVGQIGLTGVVYPRGVDYGLSLHPRGSIKFVRIFRLEPEREEGWYLVDAPPIGQTPLYWQNGAWRSIVHGSPALWHVRRVISRLVPEEAS